MISIPVWAYSKRDNFFHDILGKAIVYFTGYPYTHVGIYYGGKLYESTVWVDEKKRLRSGIRVTTMGDPSVSPPTFCMVPLVMPVHFLKRVGEELARFEAANKPYNVFKLFALAIVWPTRWFWKKIRWVPFRDDIFGSVCSTFVDTVMYRARWDLFPDEWESYTVPGQFASIPGWSSQNCLLNMPAYVDQGHVDIDSLGGTK